MYFFHEQIFVTGHKCENCSFRPKYDNNADSFLGRLWRFYINFCPGWKRYVTDLAEEKSETIAQNYNQQKYLK